MQLKTITYQELLGDPREWTLSSLGLQQINLIVGKNASGKTRTLNVINGLARMLASPIALTSGKFDADFQKGADRWTYHLEISGGKAIAERLTLNGRVFLERERGGVGRIYAEKAAAMMDFQSPDDRLAVTTREDAIQHPFLSDLIGWGRGTYHYPFGTSLGQRNIALLRVGAPEADLKDPDQTVGVFHSGRKRFGETFIQRIIDDMQEIGYDITDIGLAVPKSFTVQGLREEPQVIYIRERDIRGEVDQISMSAGMFRALAIIIQINFGLLSGDARCILLDDIGEGLDFDRSTSLIKLIIRKIAESNMQIVMTSNDRFVMNSVDLKFWTVLSRNGNKVDALNAVNRADNFNNFKYTGLNNFDFFSRDFLRTHDR